LVQAEVLENLVYDLGLLNAGDHFHPGGAPLAATLLAFLNIYREDALKSLCPSWADPIDRNRQSS
jgi:hypothetical protein